MKIRLRPLALTSLALVAAATFVLMLPDARNALLRRAGMALVRNDLLRPADVIVIATDADGAGVLAAVDLVHARLADRVAVFEDPPDSVDREFLRRGVAYFNAAAVSVQQLRALGVSNITTIPRPVAGTEDEGAVLPGWCDSIGVHTVIFVSTADHSRRVRRVLRRAMASRGTVVLVRASPYSAFDPGNWWRTRRGARTGIVELQKLLWDRLRHPWGD
jgi:hypothetical protein